MKKLIITLFTILLAVGGIFYINSQTEDGLLEELRILLTPDPMEINTYDEGECTYYVFDKIAADNMMIERSWSDAEHWAERAKADGYTVNHSPKQGALMQTDRGDIGHVAYIEMVHDDGSFTVSEMNLNKPYEITERTISQENIEDYYYIHPKVNKHRTS